MTVAKHCNTVLVDILDVAACIDDGGQANNTYHKVIIAIKCAIFFYLDALSLKEIRQNLNFHGLHS